MAAPTGNKFWKLRTTHGRDKIFTDPDILWSACVEYFEATDKRKWVTKDWVGKNAKMVKRETETPYTKSGLALFIGCDWRTIESLKEDANKDFLPIITRIEQIIYTQKIEGATVGAFSHHIVARELGLADKAETTVAVSAADPATLKAIADRMNG